MVVQARLSGNLADGGSSSLHWSAKTQLSAPQDLSLLHSYQILTTVFQLLFINPYNNLHIWHNSFEEVWRGKTSKFCNTRAKYGINFFSRFHFYIQQEKKYLLWSFKLNYTQINFQNYVNFISYIMLLTQLSVINVHLFSWIWTSCQANITHLLFRPLQEQSIVFHKGAVIIQTVFWTSASPLSKFKKKKVPILLSRRKKILFKVSCTPIMVKVKW